MNSSTKQVPSSDFGRRSLAVWAGILIATVLASITLLEPDGQLSDKGADADGAAIASSSTEAPAAR